MEEGIDQMNDGTQLMGFPQVDVGTALPPFGAFLPLYIVVSLRRPRICEVPPRNAALKNFICSHPGSK